MAFFIRVLKDLFNKTFILSLFYFSRDVPPLNCGDRYRANNYKFQTHETDFVPFYDTCCLFFVQKKFCSGWIC